ncbi:helix-turn-helix domain-containing protein [Poritiphilus flavus]|nr:helix-turn-helix transcriptional regulator [Poritiphilus flavus]
MLRHFCFLFLLLTGASLLGQDVITGYVSLKEPALWEKQVYLSRIELNELQRIDKTRLIAVSPISQDGYFSFKRELLPEKESVYRLHIKAIKKAIGQLPKHDQLILLSNKDRLHFEKGDAIFDKYRTTNLADREWQRLRRFEREFYASEDKEEHLISGRDKAYRSFAKDSLQILMVKLISIRELANKQLLNKDILENPTYYQGLLEELRSSEIDQAEYYFLEQRLLLVLGNKTARNYEISIWVNLLLGGLVLFLLGLMLKARKKRQEVSVPLSRQESNVRSLILEGKTNKEIANELFISVNTVKTHITNIYQKLDVRSRKELLQKK